MKEYTLIFVFNTELTKTLLIRKTHPEWQVGKLNGLGGTVEPQDYNEENIGPQGEDSIGTIFARLKAAERELWEEARMEEGDDYEKLTHYLDYKGPDYEMSCYWTITSDQRMLEAVTISNARSESTEKLEIWHTVKNKDFYAVVNVKEMVRGGYAFLNLAYRSAIEHMGVETQQATA